MVRAAPPGDEHGREWVSEVAIALDRASARGVPAQAYLAWVFERLGTHRDVFALSLEAMTPAAFRKTLA